MNFPTKVIASAAIRNAKSRVGVSVRYADHDETITIRDTRAHVTLDEFPVTNASQEEIEGAINDVL